MRLAWQLQSGPGVGKDVVVGVLRRLGADSSHPGGDSFRRLSLVQGFDTFGPRLLTMPSPLSTPMRTRGQQHQEGGHETHLSAKSEHLSVVLFKQATQSYSIIVCRVGECCGKGHAGERS